jgi:hypothetical protein
MSRRAALILAGAFGLFAAVISAGAADSPARQPVFILLYSRFYDHTHQRATDERLQRLLPLLERLHNKYPQSGISALLQFNGTVAPLLAAENAGLHLVDRIQDLSRRGIVEIGYTGEEEPSYINRPRANTLLAETAEERWKLKAAAADHFLNDFKDPVTGQPVEGLSGGLKGTQELLGNAAFVSGVNPALFSVGGDSWVTNEVRKMSPNALMVGIPPADVRRGISSYPISADRFSHMMSPQPLTSPEVFWEDGILRVSDYSLSDNTSHTTEEDPEALKKFFAKLDRSHVRVIKLEVDSYLRYLNRRPDGSLVADPMEWTYYHPDDPKFPITMKPLVMQTEIEAANRKEDAFLAWLLDEFLPANPGSRFVSVADLGKMAHSEDQVSRDKLKAAATDLEARFAAVSNRAPDYVKAGDNFLSLADCFELFTKALAALDATGSLPASDVLTRVYGPLEIPEGNMGLTTGSISVAAVIHKAAELAPKLARDEWKVVPENAVPVWVDVAGQRLNAAQFLRLMAQSYLDPSPDRVLKFNGVQMFSDAAFMFPKNTIMPEQGMSWTLKPAVLHLESAASATGR